MPDRDLIDYSQRALRGAGALLRRRGVLPQDDPPRRSEQGAARDAHFARGYKQVAGLARDIEAHTGQSMQRRRALDFGCGFGRLALPLAERCDYVYGLDISRGDLLEADRNAKRMNVTNVEWATADKLADLHGSYDLALSHWVFAHIPSRQGERTFASLVHGLRPGGVGAIHVTVRPPDSAMRGLLKPNWSYVYLLMNSYSLNRLGAILAGAGVKQWHVKWHTGTEGGGAHPFPSATLIFVKPGDGDNVNAAPATGG